MRFLELTIFTIVLSLVELFLIPLPFVFIALLLWSQFQDEKEALLLAFLAGIFFDIVLLRPLAATALLFTTLLFIGSLYKKKFHTDNLLFLALLTFVSLAIVEFSFEKSISFIPLFSYTIVTLILARIFFKTGSSYESWYRIS